MGFRREVSGGGEDLMKACAHVPTRVLLLVGLFFGALLSGPALATGVITVNPITWNVVGLDSNSPTSASSPYRFPVGARVCTADTSTVLSATFVWDDAFDTFVGAANAHPYINLRAGSRSAIPSFTFHAPAANSGCLTGQYYADAYFEAEVTKAAASFDKTRRYYITATQGASTVSTTRPRDLYVEHLISQNRNGITDVKLDSVSVPPGGTMNLVVGNTYTIEMDGYTATQGYNQFEGFVNFSNTVFQILSVNTTYTADSNTTTVPNPSSGPYANACVWDNNPASPTYKSCLGGDDKAGGTVVTTYTVKILGGGGTTENLNTLLYDFSGSSFHYNGDFSVGGRIASIIDPATSLTFSKSFSPSTIAAGGTSTLAFVIKNSTSTPVSGVQFADTLPTSPGAMKVAAAPAASTTGCGSPTFAPVAASASVSFSGGTIAGGGTCTIQVNVTAPATGTYANQTGPLYVNATVDTTLTASASLTVTSTPPVPSCIPGASLVSWTMAPAQGTGVPPAPTTGSQAPDVSSATASFVAGSGGNSISTSLGNPVNSWDSYGYAKSAVPTASTAPYYQFAIDTSNYSTGAAKILLDAYISTNWGNSGNALYVWSSSDGTNWSAATNSPISLTAGSWATGQSFTAAAASAGTTYFRVNAMGANNTNSSANLALDNVTFTGCGTPRPPEIAKAFAPAAVGLNGTSVLTFTLTNRNTGAALTGVAFSDTYPTGLSGATSVTSNSCGGTVTATATGLDLAGGTIPVASNGTTPGTCAISLTVTGTAVGQKDNVSGVVSSTNGGTNTGPTGFATASLAVLAPPVVTKWFSPTSILRSIGVSTMTFQVTNPNSTTALAGVAFSDSFPTSPGAMTVSSPATFSATGCGSPTFLPVAGNTSIAFSGGTIAAGGTCLVTVNVSATAAGTYHNTSTAVSATTAGTGLTSNTAHLTVNSVSPSLDLRKEVSYLVSGPWTKFLAQIPGLPVYYRFSIYNSGDVALTSLSVTDPTLAGTGADPAGCNWSSASPLAPGDTATCVEGPVNAVAGYHMNTATASGQYSGSTYTSSPNSASYLGVDEGFSLLKEISTSAAGPWSSSISGTAGANLYFRFTVTNVGYSARKSGPRIAGIGVTLTSVNVTDPTLVDASSCKFTDPLTVDAVSVCVVGPVVAASAPGVHTNTATAHGTTLISTVVDTLPSSASYSISASPALAITKTHVGSFTQGQAGAAYTITVGNAGSVATSGTITVTDTLPAGLTYVSATGTGWSCGASGQVVTCTSSDVIVAGGMGAAITLTVNVASNAGTPLVNTASASGGGASNTPTATDSTAIVQLLPVLAIAKAHSGSFTQGQTGTYTVTVSNPGTGATSGGITVTDTLPEGMTYVSATGTGWTCSGSGQFLRCDSSTVIAAGGTGAAITLTVNVASNAGTPLVNSAGATGGGSSSHATAFDSTVIVQVPVLAIAKAHSGSFTQGQTGTYTVTVSNAGTGATAGTITVTDTLPAGMTYVSATGTGWTCSGSGQSMSCTSSTVIAAGGTGSAITLTVDVASNAGTPLVNQAGASGGGASNTPTATDSTVVVQVPVLAITKTHGASFTQGQTGTYTVTVSNTGTGATSGTITVTDTLPAGMTYASATGTGWTCSGSGQSMSCTSSTVIAAGGTGSAITLTVNVASDAPALLTNVASASGGGATNAPTASDQTVVGQLPSLTIAKSHSGNFAQGQAGAVYTVTVGNSGSAATSGTITVTDTLPAGLTYVSAAGTGWSCGAASQVVTCTSNAGVTIAVGATSAITLTVNVASNAPASVTNVATASGGGAPNTPSASDPTTVTQLPVLAVAKSHAGTFRLGEAGAIYTITVGNTGGTATSGTITVTDTLPAGLTYVSAAGTGWSCGAAGQAVTCTSDAGVTIAVGATSAITLTVNVAADAPPLMINRVTASGGGAPETVTATDPTPVGQASIPTLSGVGLASLAVFLALAGALLARRGGLAG